MDRVSRFFGNLPGLGGRPATSDALVVDTAEKVQISSLALLKMLKHGTRMLKGSSHILSRSSWCTHGSNGFDVRTIYRRLHYKLR